MSVVGGFHLESPPGNTWAGGDRVGAFETVYRHCWPPLVELCRRTLAGRGDAEAVAQESFARAWMSLDRFNSARPFWPWVASIAKRLCLDDLRRLDRELIARRVGTPVHGQSVPAAPEEVVEAADECRSARLALAALEPAQQRVITLRDVRGLSYAEIARSEGVTTEAVRGSLKRARVSLRQSYARLADPVAPLPFSRRRLR